VMLGVVVWLLLLAFREPERYEPSTPIL
jgi:hypothetical protein